MNNKEYYRIASLAFFIIAIGHATRAVYGWDAVIAGVAIPIWCSWVAVALAGYLAFRGFSMVHTLSTPKSKSKKKRIGVPKGWLIQSAKNLKANICGINCRENKIK